MQAKDRQKEILELAWIGDAVLALYARRRILREGMGIDNAKAIRMTSNRFLQITGEASMVEAGIGRIYDEKGEAEAFRWIEETLLPVFEKQERRIAPPPRLKTKLK